MKYFTFIGFLLCYQISISQHDSINATLLSNKVYENEKRFENCTNKACQIKESFLNAEYFLEEDDIFSSQNWLDKTKNLISLKEVDTTTVFVHSLQSELFYYNGLHQFAINEADKALITAHKLKDSLLISNGYFFKGINLMELNKLNEAEKFLWKSRNFQPKNVQKTYLRSSILNEHIYNNIAQLKQHLKQTDSAIFYNTKAYWYAKKSHSKRGIPNTEQTFAQIYLEQNDTENALLYLNKSILSAQKSNYFDVVLVNYGLMLHCYLNNEEKTNLWFQKALDLINEKKINITYQTYFYEIAIKAFKKSNQVKNLTFAQDKLIRINEDISLINNSYIQNITKKYFENENKLLKQELDLIKNQREKQIYFIASVGLIIFSLGIWFFFIQKQKIKNKEIITLQQQKEIAKLEALMDGEEKERMRLAQDLHDGINGDLSYIKYHLSSIEYESLSNENKTLFDKSIDMIDYSCDQVRNISHNLSPTTINDFGLITSLKNYCNKLEGFHPIKINFQHFGNDIKLSKNIETVIYRIIQELVNNIIKHADASEAVVQINSYDDNLFITVEDNGKGFESSQKNAGIGLKNIASRIAFLNATLEEEHNANGTTFTINIDLNNIPKT
ncbi:ATP-binding protein [Mariniflexile gromovii]|uniref:histidine kinase n=1 Tax=Mariniflexile gromovii TaxID=362523 RepID=A0ABS4BUY8_9FLAO|nr:sensor histidine kinase [Mariniflexile gromovii]MBP0904412.1 sensor histidine kinase [Mariniflexile gromovii]